MKITISKKRDGSFQGDDGLKKEYYWYKGVLSSNGATIEFGSKDGGHKFDKELDLSIEKTERTDGSFKYKEVSKV